LIETKADQFHGKANECPNEREGDGEDEGKGFSEQVEERPATVAGHAATVKEAAGHLGDGSMATPRWES
jgi:hypothetical protein